MTTGPCAGNSPTSASLHARTSDDLSATVSQLRKAEAGLREQESLIEDLRLNVKDREAIVVDLENQLSIETERARNITEENQALRLEAQEADQTVARAERELIETREQERPPRPRGQAAPEGGGGTELPALQPDQPLRRDGDAARDHAPARIRARDQAHVRTGAPPAARDAARIPSARPTRPISPRST